jgi:DNA-binding transcriptional LysR family regulator
MSSIAAVLALVRAGYGLATLPLAAIALELESGALIGLRAEPELAGLPVIASRRRLSESPLVEAAVQLAIKAARIYASASCRGYVVIDGDQI